MSRDRAFIEKKYEQFWGDMRDYLRGLRADPAVDFELAFARALQHSNRLPASDTSVPSLVPNIPFFIMSRAFQLTPVQFEYLWRDLVAHEVLRAVRSDADVVAELGSGWSANVFNLWLRGSPRGAAYFGAELTEGGRQAAEAMAGFRPAMRFAAPKFDWAAPDFSFIPPGARHVTVYSCHSVEQIPQLDAGVLRLLLRHTAAAESVRGVFIEPVGWQFPEFAPDAGLNRAGGDYARSHDYNTNLRAMLEVLGTEKSIRIVDLAVDKFGTEINPSTVIHWERA